MIRVCTALFVFLALTCGANAQSQTSIQALINTDTPIAWQNGLSGVALQTIFTNLNEAIFQGAYLPPFTIATLPTCNSTTNVGLLVYVTNGASSPTYNATVSATGTTVVPVFCNGTNWTYH